MRDHRKLKAFQLSDQLVFEVYRETRSFPNHELFGLTSQMRRSAVSACANIVEGCARRTKKDFLHFLTNAFASLRELGYLIELGIRLEYLTGSAGKKLRGRQVDAACRLRNLIQSFDTT